MAWEFTDIPGFTSTRFDSSLLNNVAINFNSDLNPDELNDPHLVIGTSITDPQTGLNNTVYSNVFSTDGLILDYDADYWSAQNRWVYGYRIQYSTWGTRARNRPYEVNSNIELLCSGLAFLVNEATQRAVVYHVFQRKHISDVLVTSILSLTGSDSEAAFLYTWITGHPIISWTCWNYIKGNYGRYRGSLTRIKDSSIGNFTGQITGDSSDMDYISSQVDMVPVVQNMLYNVEQTIAWSGNDCWLTLTVHEVTGQPNKAQLMFKFYARGHSATSPIFSFASEIGVSGIAPDKHFYLAFVYDDANYAALFCPIRVTDAGSYIWGYVNSVSETEMLNIWQWLHMTDAGEDDRPDNPYDVGTPDNGGTDGIIQPPDEVNPGQLPTLDATTKGLFTVYLPTETQLGDIASFMWSDDVLDNFKKYFNNFNQNILALYVLPYAPTNPPTKPFKVGRVESDTITAVGYLNQRFVSIDMGEFTVKPRWGSYLDYAPYTKFEIYLPGIGMQVLDTDDIMSVTDDEGNVSATAGSIISLEYHLDLITGVCVAYVKINNDVKYQFPGKLGYTIPLTGEDYGRMITAFATVAAGVAGGIAYGGISAPLKNPAIGHMVGGEVSAAVAGTVNAMKPEVHRSGNLSCEASALSTDTPYLIRSMPNKPELVNQQVFTGFPSYKSGVLSDFDGYTECLDAHVEGISCTEEERNMLIEWLRKGVIL